MKPEVVSGTRLPAVLLSSSIKKPVQAPFDQHCPRYHKETKTKAELLLTEPTPRGANLIGQRKLCGQLGLTDWTLTFACRQKEQSIVDEVGMYFDIFSASCDFSKGDSSSHTRPGWGSRANGHTTPQSHPRPLLRLMMEMPTPILLTPSDATHFIYLTDPFIFILWTLSVSGPPGGKKVIWSRFNHVWISYLHQCSKDPHECYTHSESHSLTSAAGQKPVNLIWCILGKLWRLVAGCGTGGRACQRCLLTSGWFSCSDSFWATMFL